MNSIERLLLDSGFSWTLSKLLPYILAVLFGAIIIVLLRKRLSRIKKLWSILIKVVILVIPFVCYFAYAPIYEGDFSNDFQTIERTEANAELSGNRLYGLTIPGCPYCFDAIQRMKILKERQPDLQITYIVCTKEVANLDWYKEEAGDVIEVVLAKNSDEMIEIAEHSFPSFVLSKEGEPLKAWPNDSFGVMALDEIEALVE